LKKQEVMKAIAETIVEYKIRIDQSYPDLCPAYHGAVGGIWAIAEKLNLNRQEITSLIEEIYYSRN